MVRIVINDGGRRIAGLPLIVRGDVVCVCVVNEYLIVVYGIIQRSQRVLVILYVLGMLSLLLCLCFLCLGVKSPQIRVLARRKYRPGIEVVNCPFSSEYLLCFSICYLVAVFMNETLECFTTLSIVNLQCFAERNCA